MKFLLLLLLTNSYAGDISNSFCSDIKCITAFDKAQEAFLIQTGYIDFQNKFVSYIKNRAKEETFYLINKYDLQKYKREATVGLLIYNTINTQEIKFKWMDKDWTFGINKIYVRIPLP